MNYHKARNYSKTTARFVQKCKKCGNDFHSFYLLREHKRKEFGVQICSGTRNVVVTQLMGDVDDNSRKEELETCKHFLVDSEIKNGRHRVYNFAMDTLDPKNVLKKLDVVFDSLKCAAKLIVTFGFLLKKREIWELQVSFCTRKYYLYASDLNLWLLLNT